MSPIILAIRLQLVFTPFSIQSNPILKERSDDNGEVTELGRLSRTDPITALLLGPIDRSTGQKTMVDHRCFTLAYRTTTSIRTSKKAHAVISADCMRSLSKTFLSQTIEEPRIIFSLTDTMIRVRMDDYGVRGAVTGCPQRSECGVEEFFASPLLVFLFPTLGSATAHL